MSLENEFLSFPRRRRTQAERRQEAEQRLLESAMQLVSKKGVAALTLGEVGEGAGYSRALPAHHFGNKEGLLKALAIHIRKNFSRKSRERTPKPKAGLDAVFATASFYLARAQALDTGAKAMSAIIMEASINRGPLLDEVQASNRATLDFLEEQLRIGIAQGEVRPDIDPAAQAAIIISMLRGLSILHTMDESVDLKEVEMEMMAMLRCRLQAG